MRIRRLARLTVLIVLAVAAGGSALFATPAEADLTSSPNPGGSSLLSAGGDLLTGNPAGAAAGLVGGAAGAVASTTTDALIAGIDGWVTGSAQTLLNHTASALSNTTSPQLRTTWFSSTYWRMAAIAAVLTLPFLFAAAVQALLRSDLSMLARAAFGYLPLAMLAIAIAAPLTTLLLAAGDQLCSFISAAAGHAGAQFLGRIGIVAAAAAASGSPFLAFLVGLFMIAAAFTLWVELLLREAAVYVIVLMLPLGFAAFVWPARRIWVIRAVELLVALILSKFAIVAVLSLGGAAVGSAGNLTGLMAGAVLIMLAAFSPWALLRLIPLAEIASGAAGPLRGEIRPVGAQEMRAEARARRGEEGWMRRAEEMRRAAEAGSAGAPASGRPATGSGSEAPAAPQAGAPASPQADALAPPPADPPAGPPADAPAPPPADAGAGPPADAAAGPPAQDASGDSRAETLSERPTVELDLEHFDSTPVWPNEDAL
jgi:hypothetical protein